MPKIPTFTAQARPTAEAPSVRTGIQISPTATPAAGLLPALNQLTDYSIKKRDTAEKVEAAKKVFEIKGELDKYLEAEKENINDEDAINNFKTKYNNYLNQQLGGIKNNRVKKRIQQNLDLEYSEYVYNIKNNSYKALETESLTTINNEINSLSGKYATSDNPILKVKYKTQAKEKVRQFVEDFDLPKNVLDKKLQAVDRDFLLADMQQFAGKINGASEIKNLDDNLNGSKFLNDQDFSVGVYNAYNSKISELTVKGDPNSDYDRAVELLDELKEFERSNGYKVKTGDISVKIDSLEQKILNEQISHDKIIRTQGDNKLFYGYANDLKDSLSKSIADPFGQPELQDRLAAVEIEQEFDKRIKEYTLANPEATLAEKQAYARSTTYVLKSKYEDNKIEKASTFNLQQSDTEILSQYNDTVNDMKKLSEGTLDQDTIESYESLARANGYQDIQSFMNDYLPLLKSQIQGQ
jgi:hypothetical protein